MSVVRRPLSQIARVELVVDGAALGIYVKVHTRAGQSHEWRRGKVLVEFEILQLLHQRFRGISGCHVVRPIACFPDDLTVVTEESPGVNLHSLIKRDARWWRETSALTRLSAHCEGAGVWLRHFQEITAQHRRAEVPSPLFLERLRVELDACVSIGLPRGEASRMLGFCTDELGRVGTREFSVVGVHPDFQPDNVLVSGSGVSVLDFGSFQHGLSCSDVARFLASLEFFSRTPIYREPHMRQLMRAFLHGYGARESGDGPLLEVSIVRAFARLVGGVRTWSYVLPIGRLARWRAIAFLSAWDRRLAGIRAVLDLAREDRP